MKTRIARQLLYSPFIASARGWLASSVAALLLAVTLSASASESVIFDIDLTKGPAAVKSARGSVVGGAWDGGWRVTAHGQRIILDAGRPLQNGLLEVWYTKKGDALNADGVKGQWVSLHQSDGKLTAEYVQLRGGQQGYGFSKLRAKANEQAVSSKLNKLTHKRCEVKAGEVGDWATDDRTVMHTTIRWQDGVVSFTTPNGQPTACTNYFQFPPPYVIDALRYVYLGSDETENGGSLPGLRFKRVRLVDLGGKAPTAK